MSYKGLEVPGGPLIPVWRSRMFSTSWSGSEVTFVPQSTSNVKFSLNLFIKKKKKQVEGKLFLFRYFSVWLKHFSCCIVSSGLTARKLERQVKGLKMLDYRLLSELNYEQQGRAQVKLLTMCFSGFHQYMSSGVSFLPCKRRPKTWLFLLSLDEFVPSAFTTTIHS